MTDYVIAGFGAVLIVLIVYQMFISDTIQDLLSQSKANSAEKNAVQKITQVKLISDNAKDIEKFIVDNAAHLSNDDVKKLVARMEIIKADKVIDTDAVLKSRIDSLEMFEEAPAQMASKRKR